MRPAATERSHVFILLLAAVLLPFPTLRAQSSQSQPSNSQQDIPDAPSAVQPPQPKADSPEVPPPAEERKETKKQPNLNPFADAPKAPIQQPSDQQTAQEPAQRHLPPTESGSPGKPPRNQVNPAEGLYTYRSVVNFVLVPVTVKDSDGRPVDGLEPKDFSVYENGKKQALKFFTSDPFPLSVAILLDTGMPDIAVQDMNKTYSALVGAFSPYDEVSLYTYSSTVSQVSDFTARQERLTAVLNQIKLVHGNEAGPPVMGGPLAAGPTVNGMPVGGAPIPSIGNPPKEYHVLNDAILRAAIDLGKRDKSRRKVIFIVSDGRERGSRASYRDVLRVLQSRNIQVRAIVVDSSALPVFHQVEKIHHIPFQGYADILPKYTSATGGGQPLTELSRNSIEAAYADVMSEARNQYTLGYNAQAVVSASAYRDLVVTVDRKGLKVYAKDGYYPLPNQTSGTAAGAPPVSAPDAPASNSTNPPAQQHQ